MAERESPLDYSAASPRGAHCRKCALGGSSVTGVPADGRAGGLLVLGGSVADADATGGMVRPWTGRVGAWVRAEVQRVWSGPIAWDYAVRCRWRDGASLPGDASLPSSRHGVVEECRTYTAEVIETANPERILLLSPDATASVLGVAAISKKPGQLIAHGYDHMSSRRGYGWVSARASGSPQAPAFLMLPPFMAMSNRHLTTMFREDLIWACTVPISELHGSTPLDYDRCETVADVEEACRQLLAAGSFAQDAETVGRMGDSDYRIVALALSTLEDPPRTWTISDALLGDPATRAALAKLYARARLVTGHNNKYDVSAVAEELSRLDGVLPRLADARTTLSSRAPFPTPSGAAEPRGELADTLLECKVIDVDALADLGKAALQVGMGHKDRVKGVLIPAACKEINKLRKTYRTALNLPAGTLTRAQAARLAAHAESQFSWQHKTGAWSVGLLAAGRQPGPRDPRGAIVARDLALAVASEQEPYAYAYALADRDEVEAYNAADAATSACLERTQRARIAADPAADLTWGSLVQPAIRAVSRMERWGIAVDDGAIRAFAAVLSLKIAELREELRIAGLAEPGSNPEVIKFLFGRLGLRPSKRTPKGAESVDEEVLQSLSGKHPAVDALIAWRKVTKMDSNYATGLRYFIRGDGRIHPSFKVAGTKTGRMSCTEPNLQTIPSRGEWAKWAKSVFMPRRGRVLVQHDFNQQELRVASGLSGDKKMIDIFVRGEDYHGKTAKIIGPMVWNVQWWKPTDADFLSRAREAQLMDDIRRAAKVVNFGILYGMGDELLGRNAKCTTRQARKVREVILGEFATLDRWIKEQLAFARNHGVTRTFWEGRTAHQRPLWRVSSTRDEERTHAEHASWNTPVQGTAAYYCNVAVAELIDWIDANGSTAQVVLTVHDSILTECDEGDVDEVVSVGRQIMEARKCGDVPLRADVKVGPSWGDLKEVKP